MILQIRPDRSISEQSHKSQRVQEARALVVQFPPVVSHCSRARYLGRRVRFGTRPRQWISSDWFNSSIMMYKIIWGFMWAFVIVCVIYFLKAKKTKERIIIVIIE